MCADADTYTSTCVQMTLNHLVKMRTRPTQNVIFTPNAPYIAPYLLCSWRDNEGITSSCLANDLAKNKYRPRHRNAKGWDAAGIWSGTTLLCGCPTKVSPVCRAVPMGFMCTPWKAAKAPCWVKIWGLLESREPDGSSSISKALWSVLVCLAASVKGPTEGPLSLLRKVGGVGMSRNLAFFIPCNFIHAYSSFSGFCSVQW